MYRLSRELDPTVNVVEGEGCGGWTGEWDETFSGVGTPGEIVNERNKWKGES